MATTKARQGSHGAAYSEYAGMKDKAIYIGGEHLDCVTFIDSDSPDMEEIWYEFAEEGSLYPNIKNTCIMLESSPTPEEMQSMGINSDEEALTAEQKAALMDYAKELLDKMDEQEITYHRKDKDGKFYLDENGKKKKFKVPKTHLRNSKWFCMLHRDSKSGIWHLHFLISRFTYNGFSQNDPRMIAKRAARASELLNQNRGWKSAEVISRHHQNEIKDTIYDVLRGMEKFSWNDFKEAVESRTYRNYKGEEDNYELMFRNDSKGNVVGYSVWRGNSNYNASKIGKQLTAARIQRTWQELHRPGQIVNKPSKPSRWSEEGRRIRAEEKRKAAEARLAEQKKSRQQSLEQRGAHDAVVKSLRLLDNFAKSSFNVFTSEEKDSLLRGIVAKCLLSGRDATKTNLDAAIVELVRMVGGMASQLEKAIPAMHDITSGLPLPPVVTSSGGGGVSPAGGWRGKDDDDRWKWYLLKGFGLMRPKNVKLK